MRIDKTAYAEGLGYAGDEDVIVENGRVVSHGNVAWETFIQRLPEYSAEARFSSLPSFMLMAK